MKNKIIDSLKFLKVEKLKNEKQIGVFLICVLIATVLWFLNALSKDYVATISYPVKYVNPPKNQFLANSPPAKFELQVEAHGFTLLRHKLSLSFSPIVLNLTAITRNIKPEDGSYNIRSETLIRRISNQVSNEISITEIRPEFVSLVLDSLISKTVNVELNIKTGFKPQYNLKEPITSIPQNVKITGPAAILDTIQVLRTELKSFNNLDATLERSLSIIHPQKTTLSPEKVILKIPVEKFTEKEIKVPVTVRNKPEGINIKLFPSEVKLTFLIGLSEFESVTTADFNVFVDYQSISDGNNESLEVVIESKPSYIQLVRISPSTVEFLIETM